MLTASPTSRPRRPALSALLALLATTSVPGANTPAPIDRDQALSASQAALGRPLGEYGLIDQSGRPLSLSSLRGRPYLISFVYTSCAFACPTLTSRLDKVTKVARAALGANSFSIVTVGFDAGVDTVERMRRFARERGIDQPSWYFAASDPAGIERLAADTGFVFAPLAGGYDHVAQVTIVDPAGRVYAQVYGDDFEPTAIVEPLKTLLLGATPAPAPAGGWLNTVRLLCTVYDPKSGRYRFDYSLILEIVIGIMCTLAISIFVVRAWNQTRA